MTRAKASGGRAPDISPLGITLSMAKSFCSSVEPDFKAARCGRNITFNTIGLPFKALSDQPHEDSRGVITPAPGKSSLDDRLRGGVEIGFVTCHVGDKLLIAERFPDPVTAKQERIACFKLHRRLTYNLLQSINQVVGHRPSLAERSGYAASFGMFPYILERDFPLHGKSHRKRVVASKESRLASSNQVKAAVSHMRDGKPVSDEARADDSRAAFGPSLFKRRKHAIVRFVNPLLDLAHMGLW